MKKFLVAAIVMSLTVFGQTGTDGSMLGTVADSSGAVMPGAVVTVTNIETGISKRAVTDSGGYFQVLALQRGLYSVTVQKTGFTTWQLQRIELTAGENKRVSPVLQVGTAQRKSRSWREATRARRSSRASPAPSSRRRSASCR